MGKKEYIPPPHWTEGQQGIEAVMQKGCKKLVCEVLESVVNDIEARPDLMPDFVKDKKGKDKENPYKKTHTMNKETAIWFTFKSKNLKYWCDLVGISHLRFRRGINELLEGQE